MITPPLVSVICITYRHEKFIGQALEGIVMQRTDFPFEVIVHDDASSDGTADVLRDYERRYPELIKPIYQTVNQHSREKGFVTRTVNAAAKGKYIALCDGDDIWTDPDKLAKQVALLEADPTITGTYHATRIMDHEGKDTGKLLREELPDQLDTEGTMAELSPFHTSSFVYRVGRYPEALPAWTWKLHSADMVLFTLVAGEGRLCKVEGVMSSYRKHAGGITTTTVQNGASYHWHRILLWLFMDRHFNYRYTAKCEELLLEHWRRILWQSTPKQRLNYLARSVRAVPGWFLRKPLFSIQRFLEAVKR